MTPPNGSTPQKKKASKAATTTVIAQSKALKNLKFDSSSVYFLIFQTMILPGLLEDPSEELAKRHLAAADVTIFQKDKKYYMCYTLYFPVSEFFLCVIVHQSCAISCMFITNFEFFFAMPLYNSMKN